MKTHIKLACAIAALLASAVAGCVAPPPQPVSPPAVPLTPANPTETSPASASGGMSTEPIAGNEPSPALSATGVYTTVLVTWLDSTAQPQSAFEQSVSFPVDQVIYYFGLPSLLEEVTEAGDPQVRAEVALAHSYTETPSIPPADASSTWVLLTTNQNAAGDAVWQQAQSVREADGSVRSEAIRILIDGSQVITFTQADDPAQSLQAVEAAAERWSQAQPDGKQLWIDFAVMQETDITGQASWVLYAFLPPDPDPGAPSDKPAYCAWLRCKEATTALGSQICTWIKC